eukprot:6848708-Prymnesium_polylepis.1
MANGRDDSTTKTRVYSQIKATPAPPMSTPYSMIPVPSRVSQLDWALVVSSKSIVTGWRDADGHSGGGCIGNLNLDA